MKLVIGEISFPTEIIEYEEPTSDGDIIVNHKIKREVRFVKDESSLDLKVLVRETPLPTTRFCKRCWGPFTWYEPLTNAGND